MDALSESASTVSPPPTDSIPKSPPLAFSRTSNDSLAPFTSIPLQSQRSTQSESDLSSPRSRSALSIMGLTESDLQKVVDQQSSAIDRLHDAFGAERQAWVSEKAWLYQRISSLEQLLKTRDHHSPAKSPVMSPSNGMASSNGITSPLSRAVHSTPKLPVIAEDDSILPLPLSQRREGAPQTIDLNARPPVPAATLARSSRSQRASSVSFDEDIKTDDVPISPPTTAMPGSPIPQAYRANAGHTPLKCTRPSTPPLWKMSLDGIEDTPTRNNTQINLMLTKSHEDEGDFPLTGPLSMPELPNQPDETNFTLEALSRRLEQVARSPELSRPTIYNEPSPGMLSPAEPANLDDIMASHSQHSSQRSSAVSPGSLPPVVAEPAEEQFNGVKLKKKPSVNFGAPFGQLGGFGGRKLS
ncbi:hypothetical protein LTR62_007831 [Meristemomyces frigidus]|uniref:Uncharacterized protein n=1 Tax=Meristemomyces frigidus TaxID=1508187 RepID=A0AAN7YD46_9PEZI|nr:hypothetical protein LTR62_007831 [Meristemomyces frigidus]